MEPQIPPERWPPAARAGIEEPLDRLARTADVLRTLLAGTVPRVYGVNEGPHTWSAIDVVGHLVRADETSWLPRARRILEHGETMPFDPPDTAAPVVRFAGWTIDAVVAEFASARQASLDTVRGWHLTENDLLRQGRHPDLGIVTLGQLFATWAVHDLSHLAQIARVLAKSYRGEVGVWREFPPILDVRPPNSAETSELQASSKSSPLISVSTSMRRGATPIW